MARSKNYKRKNVRSLRKSRRYTHLNGGGPVTITLGTNDENQQYLSITYNRSPTIQQTHQPASKTIYIILEKKLLGGFKMLFSLTNPNIKEYMKISSKPEEYKNIHELMNKINKIIPSIPMYKAIQEFISSYKPTKIFGISNDNISDLLKALEKELVPIVNKILNDNKQLECLKNGLIYKILQIKNPDISTEITTIRDDIWKNANDKYDRYNKVMSITQNCEMAVKALKSAPPSSDHISSELRMQMEKLAQDRKSFEEEKQKAEENARIQQAKKEADEKKTAEISRAIQECETKKSEAIRLINSEKDVLRRERDDLRQERDHIKKERNEIMQTNLSRSGAQTTGRW